MAKVKLLDLLTKLIGTDEIDLAELDNVDSDKKESTESDKAKDSESDKGDEPNVDNTSDKNDDKSDKQDEAVEKELEVIKIFDEGWYDDASGVINFDKIKNPEVLEAMKMLSGKYQAEKDQRTISDSLNATLKEYSFNVSEDTIKKVLDTSGVKIDEDGKVVGIKEAIESLKSAEPGFFRDKTKESSPLNEKFNPVEKQTTLTEDEVINLAYGQAE